LLEAVPNAQSHVFYSRPALTDRQGIDYDQPGRLTADKLRGLDLPVNAQAFVCGPDLFMDEMSEALAACGLDLANVHIEKFGARAGLTPGIAPTPAKPPHLPEGPVGPGPEIQFARSALSAQWAPTYDSLLEFAEACDVPTRWSCRSGVCHNCETALLSGQVRYGLQPLEPPAQGNVLLCIFHTVGKRRSRSLKTDPPLVATARPHLSRSSGSCVYAAHPNGAALPRKEQPSRITESGCPANTGAIGPWQMLPDGHLLPKPITAI
jgi:ferredoxin